MSVPFAARPLDVYRALRALNPSPYMYFIDLGDSQIGMLDFHRAAEAIAEGEAVVDRLYPEIERALSQWS